MDPITQNNPADIPKKKLPTWLITVTPFSKALAMILFIILPFVGFYLGLKYQQNLSIYTGSMIQVSTSIPKLTPTPQSASNDILNWKTFKSNIEGFTLKYPEDWSKEESSFNNLNGNSCTSGVEDLTCMERFDFVSPDSLRVRFVILNDEKDDRTSCGTQAVCATQNVINIENLSEASLGTIYLVEEDNYIALDKPLSQETTPFVGVNKHNNFELNYNLPSKTGGRYALFITYCFAGNCSTKFNNLSSKQFYNLPSVKNAIQILKSLTY